MPILEKNFYERIVMETQAPLYILKTKLQNFGALRPEAWEAIVQLCQQTELKTGESFIRKHGTLAYIAQGLLKEYDAQNRTQPSIINFIIPNQCLVTRKHNQNHYLKATIPTLVYYWDFEYLQQLYQEFEELKKTYDSFCAEYDEGLAYGRLILEEKLARNKIILLLAKYKPQLNQIPKKDLSNYLMLNYDYFTSLLQELL